MEDFGIVRRAILSICLHQLNLRILHASNACALVQFWIHRACVIMSLLSRASLYEHNNIDHGQITSCEHPRDSFLETREFYFIVIKYQWSKFLKVVRRHVCYILAQWPSTINLCLTIAGLCSIGYAISRLYGCCSSMRIHHNRGNKISGHVDSIPMHIFRAEYAIRSEKFYD